MSKLGTKSWGDIIKEIPSDTIAAEAAAGAAVGVGANYVSNSSTGDRGGYLGAGILGAAGGAAARPLLAKRANTKAVNLQEAKIQADTAAAEAKEAALVERQRKAIASGRRQLESGSKKTGIIERVKNSVFTEPVQTAFDQNKTFFGPQNKIPTMGPLPTMRAPEGFYDPVTGNTKKAYRTKAPAGWLEDMLNNNYKKEIPNSYGIPGINASSVKGASEYRNNQLFEASLGFNNESRPLYDRSSAPSILN